MTHNRIRGHSGRIAAVALFGLVLAWGAPVSSADPGDGANPYLGVWNYDQPDRADGTDIAAIGQFGINPLTFPQVGTVEFARGADGEITGHTDQGCTWHFRVNGDALDLTSTDQYCFNNVIASGYNITYWHVTLHDGHEQEVIRANSYLPYGTFDFELANGKRTRADAADPGEAVRSLTGTWAYDPTDLAYLNNLTSPGYQAKTGVVRIDSTGGGLVARTDDGCAWTLDAHGNTAELAPAGQTCQGPDGTVTMSFWAMAGDGTHVITVLNTTDAQGNTYFLGSGSLTRRS
ncbi:hypothetical protein GPX89_01725 [Nocardia sp. ET3-3]|uniref:Uncharacterized protein n=1 Tax=Nocardia terrae TaxID=2675851 RepID=A0A7K1UP64_9NOCA|nr:hypothetical protein [Nocardia terrae]MVU75959.1 hypothetical protein [Nocardia terrae]